MIGWGQLWGQGLSTSLVDMDTAFLLSLGRGEAKVVSWARECHGESREEEGALSSTAAEAPMQWGRDEHKGHTLL